MKLTVCLHRDAQKEVQNIALDNNFAIPGDPGFPLNQVSHATLFSTPLRPLYFAIPQGNSTSTMVQQHPPNIH